MSDREHALLVGALAPADTHLAPPNPVPPSLIPQHLAPEGVCSARALGFCEGVIFSGHEGECRS